MKADGSHLSCLYFEIEVEEKTSESVWERFAAPSFTCSFQKEQKLSILGLQMAELKSLVLNMMEEQAALLQKHIALLKSGDDPEAAAPAVDLVVDASGKKRKTKKEPVDPNKPKKSPSAYILYMGENQAPFKAANPTLTQIEVMTALGNRWTALPLESKEKFMKQADTHKQLYELKMAAYTAGSSSSSVAPKSPVKAAPIKFAAATPPKAVVPVVVAVAPESEKEQKKKKKRAHKEAEEEVVEAVVEPVAVPESEKKKKKHKRSKDAVETA